MFRKVGVAEHVCCVCKVMALGQIDGAVAAGIGCGVLLPRRSVWNGFTSVPEDRAGTLALWTSRLIDVRDERPRRCLPGICERRRILRQFYEKMIGVRHLDNLLGYLHKYVLIDLTAGSVPRNETSEVDSDALSRGGRFTWWLTSRGII